MISNQSKLTHKKKKLRAAGAFFAVLILAITLLWGSVPDPLDDVLSWPVSPVLLDKNGNLIHARLSTNEEWCLPIPLSEMGTWLPKILVTVEDKRFYSHPGVDVLALGRAITQNIRSGRVLSGASTISSQLVRLSMPRERTLRTKFLEFVGAIKLERHLGKGEILEYYLNRAPFGGTIRGVEAAARMYFGKRAKELSLGEASLLVGLLKGPTAYRPDKNPRAALRRRQQIIRQIAGQEGVSEDMAALALDEPLPKFVPSMPGEVWHFADLAFKTLSPSGGVVRSSLDMQTQSALELALREQLTQAGKGVTAAGVVVENSTGAIVAYVGNLLFDRAKGTEWVDCAQAPRSPGSTLKPFIYLAAMEDGLIIPATLLADTPLRLGGEAPRNFDKRYRGPVTAHTALADSLNAPAVRVIRMIGVRKALEKLRAAGFAHINRDNEDYGDSLVLGAGEVTALELARAYTALANMGEDRPLILRALQKMPTPARPVESYGSSIPANTPEWSQQGGSSTVSAYRTRRSAYIGPAMPAGLAPFFMQQAVSAERKLPASRRLYSSESAYLIAGILKDPGRLPFLMQLVQAREEAPIAFKTGTSFGLRDAWTAAYTPSHTAVVWFGRSNGGTDPKLLGISLAAPAALKVLREIGRGGKTQAGWYEKPTGVGTAKVCALSGTQQGPYCPGFRFVSNIPAVWRTVPCTMHVLRGGKTTLVWPPELEDFHKKRFAREDPSRAAHIVSPLPGAEYILTPGGKMHPVALKAEGVRYPVHWYADGAYLGEQEHIDAPVYWTPQDGEHVISLLDAEERIGKVVVKVKDLSRQVEVIPLL